jgi:tetratricopeptide (TPR) repeat protein
MPPETTRAIVFSPTALVLGLSLAVAHPAHAGPPEPPAAGTAAGQRQLEVIDGALDTPPPARAANPGSGEPDAATRRAAIAEALAAGDEARLEELLVEEAEARPTPAVLRQLGALFLKRGRPLNAAIALKKAEALAPLDEGSRFTLAMAYVAMGQRGWARPELVKLAEQAPATALYPYWLARLDYDDNQYAEAVRKLEKAITLDPRFMRAHDNLGLCYEALGRFDDAAKAWEAAIRLNAEQAPCSPWPALNLGVMLSRLDRSDEAEKRFRESRACDARFPQARYQLGVALDKRGEREEARAELEEAARLDPASAETQYALARLYRRTGETEKADAALRRFEELKKEARTPKAGPGPR